MNAVFRTAPAGRRLALLLLVIFAMVAVLRASPALAASPPITTSISPIGAWNGEFMGLRMAPDGSAYLGGNTYGAGVTFGSTASTSGYNGFYAKSASDGSWSWMTGPNATTSATNIYNISILPDGGVAGSSDMNAGGTYGSTTVPRTDSGANAVDASGGWAWAVEATAGNVGFLNGMDAVPNGGGAIVVGGTVRANETATFGSDVITNPRGSCSGSCFKVFLAGLAADHATWSWVATATPLSGELNVNGVTAFADGSVIVSGYIDSTGSADFGGHVVSSTTGGTFFAKLAPDHQTWLWATAVNGTGAWYNGLGAHVSGAPDGSLYAALQTKSNNSPLVLGSTTLTRADGTAVIAKLNPGGTWAWGKAVGGSTLGFGVAYTGAGCGALLSGGFSGTGTFGSTSLTSQATGDAFVGSIGEDGEWRWAKNVHLTSNSNAYNYGFWNVAGLPDGQIAVAASMADPGASFGTIPVGSATAFLGRMLQTPCVTPEHVKATAGDAKVTVSWDAVPGSSITSYAVTAGPGGKTCTATAPATSCVIEGLTNGTEYSFTVVANNAAGAGPASSAVKATPSAAAAAAASSGSKPSTKAKKPSIRILSASVSDGSRMVATVRVNRAGRVSVAGVLGGVQGCTARATAKKAGVLTVSCLLGSSARARAAAGVAVLRVAARLSASGAVARDAARSTVQPANPTPVTG